MTQTKETVDGNGGGDAGDLRDDGRRDQPVESGLDLLQLEECLGLEPVEAADEFVLLLLKLTEPPEGVLPGHGCVLRWGHGYTMSTQYTVGHRRVVTLTG